MKKGDLHCQASDPAGRQCNADEASIYPPSFGLGMELPVTTPQHCYQIPPSVSTALRTRYAQ
jgi:hypothetical protein